MLAPAAMRVGGETARKITITFELDDEPWLNNEGVEFTHDVVDEALGVVIGAVDGGITGFNRFVEATLDDELLVDGFGYATKEAGSSARYGALLRLLNDLEGDGSSGLGLTIGDLPVDREFRLATSTDADPVSFCRSHEPSGETRPNVSSAELSTHQAPSSSEGSGRQRSSRRRRPVRRIR